MIEPLHAIYYTDPLCSYSWVFEAVWRRIRWELGELLQYEYRMGGLFADVTRYQDPINDIANTAQIGPQWMEISSRTGVPLNPELWQQRPPTSSYPACIAFKAAAQFGSDFAETCLRRLREAAMLEARDISRPEVLQAVAREANSRLEPESRIDVAAFGAALSGPEARDAFREDLRDVRYREIGRFPSLILYRSPERGLLLTGCRPYGALRVSLGKVAPDLLPQRPLHDLAEYVAAWRTVTVQEIADNFGWELVEAGRRLREAGLEHAVVDAKLSSFSSV